MVLPQSTDKLLCGDPGLIPIHERPRRYRVGHGGNVVLSSILPTPAARCIADDHLQQTDCLLERKKASIQSEEMPRWHAGLQAQPGKGSICSEAATLHRLSSCYQSLDVFGQPDKGQHTCLKAGMLLTATSAEIWPAKIAVWMARKFDPPPETKIASLGTVLSSPMSGGLLTDADAARSRNASLSRGAKGACWIAKKRDTRESPDKKRCRECAWASHRR